MMSGTRFLNHQLLLLQPVCVCARARVRARYICTCVRAIYDEP